MRLPLPDQGERVLAKAENPPGVIDQGNHPSREARGAFQELLWQT